MVDLFPIGDPDRVYLITEQVRGLHWSTHVTLAEDVSDDEKIEIIREMVQHFKDIDNNISKAERITDL